MLTYMQKAIRKSRQEGREEGQLGKGISVALAMLSAGEAEEKILRFTGLSVSQLAEIRDGRK
jgi:predicted transposase/invertase (TIGR01784 family)